MQELMVVLNVQTIGVYFMQVILMIRLNFQINVIYFMQVLMELYRLIKFKDILFDEDNSNEEDESLELSDFVI